MAKKLYSDDIKNWKWTSVEMKKKMADKIFEKKH